MQFIYYFNNNTYLLKFFNKFNAKGEKSKWYFLIML